MSSPPPRLLRLLLFVALVVTASADERWAPHAVAGPVNQLVVSGNACGPAALLASLRCGDEAWRSVAKAIPGSSDRSKLLYIIKAHGLKPSESLKGRKRWTRHGVNAEDLEAIAGELAAVRGLPEPGSEALFRSGREKPEQLVRRVHDGLRDSLKRGFPPVLSLKRYVRRDGQWQVLQGHFVTVVCVPEKLKRGSVSFPITYFDPWRGKKHYGHLRIPPIALLSADGETSTCLDAAFPAADVGKSQVRVGEASFIVPVGLIGRP